MSDILCLGHCSRYTVCVLIYRFYSVLLFIGVVAAGMYTVAGAMQTQSLALRAAPAPAENIGAADTVPREARIVVVPAEPPTPTPKATPVADRLVSLTSSSENRSTDLAQTPAAVRPVVAAVATTVSPTATDANVHERSGVFTVPFYSQFTDISSPHWQKVGCGIASIAMLIDFYSEKSLSVDGLLERGVASGAYLDHAGWTHRGLINLAAPYGLSGESVSLSHLSMSSAFSKLRAVLVEGPVMASVHYTFEPTNPIPHLVVINGVRDGKVFYNDPAEASGGGELSIEQFQRAWKQRYVLVRPTT